MSFAISAAVVNSSGSCPNVTTLLCDVEATAAERHPWQLDPLAWARLDTARLSLPRRKGPTARSALSAQASPALLPGSGLRAAVGHQPAASAALHSHVGSTLQGAGGANPQNAQQHLAGAGPVALGYEPPGPRLPPHYYELSGRGRSAGQLGRRLYAYSVQQRRTTTGSGHRSRSRPQLLMDVRERMTDRDPDTDERFPSVPPPPPPLPPLLLPLLLTEGTASCFSHSLLCGSVCSAFKCDPKPPMADQYSSNYSGPVLT